MSRVKKRGSWMTCLFPLKEKGKRGLSPVIASVLLVSLALVLAIIIFMWSRSFLGESITKGERDITLSCDEILFNAEVYGDNLNVINTGSIPIQGVEIRKKEFLGDIVNVEIAQGASGIAPGQDASFDLPSEITPGSGDTLIVSPILRGETESYLKDYACGEDYGIEITV